MPIIIAPLDTEFTIQRVILDEKTKKHLESLGIVTGGKIKVISTHNGNTICVVKGVRLGLNRDVAMKILVA